MWNRFPIRVWRAMLPPMSQRSVLAWACLSLTLTSCIQRQASHSSGTEAPGSEVVTASDGSGSAVGGQVLGPAGIKALHAFGDVQKVTLQDVSVTGQPFTTAVRVEIKQASNNEWAVQMQAPTVAAVQEGDVLLATLYMRADKPLDEQAIAQTQFVFELAQAPYDKSATYDVAAASEWRKVHIPFVAKRKYGPGEAHVILRLGYDPEIFEVAGLTVQNYGKHVTLAGLPVSPHWHEPAAAKVDTSQPAIDGGALAITVDPAKAIGPISPYVYGVNSQPEAGTGATVRRMGGNRQTGYNWENNASNAGSDYRHSSDAWPCTAMGYTNCDDPGAQFLDFAAANKRQGMETLATVPLVDYVAADKSGESVTESEKAPSKRWVRSYPHKNGAYTATPDRGDGAVYQDEFVDLLVKKQGRADQGGIKFYSLDNEPSLWPSTHPRIHPERPTYREMVKRSEAVASEITTIDPSAIVLGAVMYGWNEYLTFQDAPDSKELNAQYGTYADFFLASMAELEQRHHRRLVHVLDLHWYPEAKGSKRITTDDVAPKTVEARLQAPRSLWDSTYRERSPIDDSWGKAIRLIPWFQDKIKQRYPGTRLSMTEYNFGAGKDISGGLAQIDVLGALGREGVYLANYWGDGPGNGDLPAYIAAAFKIYRNYDGKRSTYGDTAVTAAPDDLEKASVYAATDTKRRNVLTVIVINKSLRAKYLGKVKIQGTAQYDFAQAFVVDSGSAAVRPVGEKIAIKNNQLEYALPPMSATLFVCERHAS
jgi:Glycoside hydrolase family 44